MGIIDWVDTRKVAGCSSFGFSGSNSHCIMENLGLSGVAHAPLSKLERVPWNRQTFVYKDWSAQLWSTLEWRPCALKAKDSLSEPVLVVGGGAIANLIQSSCADLVFLAKQGKNFKLSDSECTLVFGNSEHMASLLSHKTWTTVVFAEPLVRDDADLQGITMTMLLQMLQILEKEKKQV